MSSLHQQMDVRSKHERTNLIAPKTYSIVSNLRERKGNSLMNKNETFIRHLFTHYYSILTFKTDHNKQEKDNLYFVLHRKAAVL